MTEYPLYLESGPMHRRTMAHVFDLLGCLFSGPTTEDAIANAPGEIRTFLHFLNRHDPTVDPVAPFETPVALHVIERGYAGYGDVAPGFPPDFEPLMRRQLATYVERYRWMHDDLIEMVRAAGNPFDMPLHGGKWTLRRLLEHVTEAEYDYLRCSLGHIDGLRKGFREVFATGDPLAALELLHRGVTARLQAITDAELAATTQRGAKTWTAARTCRRILEHRWEHLQQVEQALAAGRA